MEIFTEINFMPEVSMALGFFDGLHLGHRAVISNAVDFARKKGVKSAVLTFQDHPCCYFYGVKPKYILQRDDRNKFFEELGVDYLYLLRFDENFAKMTALDYLHRIIIHNFFPTAITTGFNHYFGVEKTGDVKFLSEMQQKFNYEYFEIAPKKVAGEVISSTIIRKSLSDGDIERANSMLGYNFFVKGEVVVGNKIGGKIGFKTANINYPQEVIDVANGVYKVVANVDGLDYPAIANWGVRPTVKACNEPILEVHIKSFDRDIYGKTIKVEFIKKLRDERKFASLDDLKFQIQKDLEL